MLLKEPIQTIFFQLQESLSRLSAAQYSSPGKLLFNASIGQHVRHIIELFVCLENGYETGIVNYEKRKRDRAIETDKDLAIQLLNDILERLERPDIDLILEAEDYADSSTFVSVATNYYREVIYNLEHTIHHMALIRVGIAEVSDIVLPKEYGVAYSTVRFRQQAMQ